MLIGFYIGLCTFILSLLGVIANWQYLQYNDIFQKFNMIEYTIYSNAGYIQKGNYCIIFGAINIIAFVIMMICGTKADEKKDKDE